VKSILNQFAIIADDRNPKAIPSNIGISQIIKIYKSRTPHNLFNVILEKPSP
jgi:hypothetical protein